MSLPTSSSSSIISTYHHATTPEIEVEDSLPSGHRSLLHQFALSKGVSRYCGKYDPDMMPQPSQQFKSGIVVNCHHQSVSQSVSQSLYQRVEDIVINIFHPHNAVHPVALFVICTININLWQHCCCWSLFLCPLTNFIYRKIIHYRIVTLRFICKSCMKL